MSEIMNSLTLADLFLCWFVYTMFCFMVVMIIMLDIPNEPFDLDPNSKLYKILSKIGIGLLYLTIPGVPIFIIIKIRAFIKKKKEVKQIN